MDTKKNAKENEGVRISPYSDKELKYFRKLLLEKRVNAEMQLDILKNSIQEHTLLGIEEPVYSTHMADAGTDVEDSDTTYVLIERTRTYITQIDEALDRIDKKTYGICQKTGKKISKERLKSVPHTRFSIDAKEEMLS